MFITLIDPEDMVDEDVMDVWKSIHPNSDDIVNCRRDIIVYEKNIRYSDQGETAEGKFVVDCTIVNTVVLDGAKNHYTYGNSQGIAVKTIYHGELMGDVKELNGANKASHKLVDVSTFRVVRAYTSHIDLWVNNEEIQFYNVSGVTVLDVFELHTATKWLNQTVYTNEFDIASMSYNIAFGDEPATDVLPLPLPYLYSSKHAITYLKEPVMIEPKPIKGHYLLDEHTHLHTVDIYPIGNKSGTLTRNHAVMYMTPDKEIIPIDNGEFPLPLVFPALPAYADDLGVNVLRTFQRYQVSAVQLAYKADKKLLMVTDLQFSFNNTPNNWDRDFVNDITNNPDVIRAFADLSIMYDPSESNMAVDIILRVSDIRYDVSMIFNQPVLSGTSVVKYVNYTQTIYDLVKQGDVFSTSATRPIIAGL